MEAEVEGFLKVLGGARGAGGNLICGGATLDAVE